MLKLSNILTMLLVLTGSAACVRANAASGTSKIATIIVTEGSAFIYAATPLTDWAACATYGVTVNRVAIDTSTAQGRAMLNAAQLALAMKLPVGFVGRKNIGVFPPAAMCSVGSTDETLFYLAIANP